MAAKRYSGSLTITVNYNDRDYDCTIAKGGKSLYKTRVGAPASGFSGGVAYDSPEAFDAIASAALSFGSNDNSDVADAAQYNESGSGYVLLRSSPTQRRSEAPAKGKSSGHAKKSRR